MVDDPEDVSLDQTLPVSPAGTLQGVRPNRARTDPAVAATVAIAADGTGAGSGSEARVNAPVPGELLEASRYRLGDVLGRGGMGEVLSAYDDRIGREVAVKRIRAEHPGAEELARFLREARVQGRLEHPAIVPVHDLAFDGQGRPFFVMKRLAGTTMAAQLEQLAAAAPGEAAGIRRRLLRAFVDVCLAIELAHQHGIVHRDLKPSNIMLGDFGEVYVLDWGIARLVSEADDPVRPSHEKLELDTGQTREGTVLGTPAYMAPEQLAGEPADARADVYSLGCILFEIAAAQQLHRARRGHGDVDARPSHRRPDSPPELDATCVHATRGDAADRPSARALGDAVQAYLDGDRDLALRKELARSHLAEARAALARGDDDASRRAAMQAAGRALALDPTAGEAAELVMQLMLHPPREVPRQVEETLERIDTETARSQGKLAAVTLVGYLAFVPLLLWTGVRDFRLLYAFIALAAGSALHVVVLTRRTKLTSGMIYRSACINAALIAVIARLVGPFIIAPTLVMTTLMSYAAHPRFGRMSVLSVIMAGAVIVPWGLELAGVLPSTFSFEHGALVLRSPALAFHSAPVQLAFAGLLVSLVAVVALLSRQMASRQREVSLRAELQSWHLRQLVPAGDG